MNNVYIQKVESDNINLIRDFLENAGSSLQSFRYFDKRPLTVTSNHLVTYLLIEDSKPVGYGHLDMENDTVWLGIALIESAIGKGYGKQIMRYLINAAVDAKIDVIQLSVDKNNATAISLYERFGFENVNEINEVAYLMKKIIKDAY